MQVIQELAFLVAKNIKNSKGLDEDAIFGASTRLPDLYQGIVNGNFSNDNEAAAALYNANKKHPAYRKLKSTLKKRLINALFLLDISDPSYNLRQKAYYDCYKNWAAVKILFGKNARQAAVNLSHRVLRQAQKYEFTDLILDVARMLRLHFGTREGDVRKFEFYDELYTQHEQIWRIENRAEQLYAALAMEFVNDRSAKTRIGNKARQSYLQLEDALKRFDNYKLHFCSYLILIIEYMSRNDYWKTIEVCEKAILFFEKKAYIAATPLLIFSYHQLVCYTQLRKFPEGMVIAEQCSKLLENGSFNWFKYQEIYFFLYMHAGAYEKAYKVFRKTVEHRQFAFLPAHVVEMWKIFEAYLYYLYCIGRFRLGTETMNFRLSKFLNDTPVFSKDKRGMNVPILIIQVLFLIWQGDYGYAENRIEAIKKYSSRYLRKNETFRSNCFIKMLLQAPSAYFHKAGLKRKTNHYLKKLLSEPLDIAGQAHEVEIIPYEVLWEFVLDSLENKFRYSSNLPKGKTAGR